MPCACTGGGTSYKIEAKVVAEGPGGVPAVTQAERNGTGAVRGGHALGRGAVDGLRRHCHRPEKARALGALQGAAVETDDRASLVRTLHGSELDQLRGCGGPEGDRYGGAGACGMGRCDVQVHVPLARRPRGGPRVFAHGLGRRDGTDLGDRVGRGRPFLPPPRRWERFCVPAGLRVSWVESAASEGDQRARLREEGRGHPYDRRLRLDEELRRGRARWDAAPVEGQVECLEPQSLQTRKEARP